MVTQSASVQFSFNCIQLLRYFYIISTLNYHLSNIIGIIFEVYIIVIIYVRLKNMMMILMMILMMMVMMIMKLAVMVLDYSPEETRA